jgi:hypothetical protein
MYAIADDTNMVGFNCQISCRNSRRQRRDTVEKLGLRQRTAPSFSDQGLAIGAEQIHRSD